MRRPLGRLLVAAALVLPLAGTGTAVAAPQQDRRLTVMTQNLYLGADLNPAVQARTPAEFLGAVATIYGTVLFTDFPRRAAALADEVAAARPDLIGLQEVSTWTVTGPTPAPSLDYLAILQAQLAARGLHYAVAAVSHNADIGPAPLVAPCSGPIGSCTVRFQDRDVVLAGTDTPGLAVGNPRSGRYTAQQVVTTPVGALSFARGWASVDGTYAGARFRFAVTHLETEDAPAVQEAQALELRAAVKAPGAVILVGDLNSAADGSTTTSYADLTGSWFHDAWRAEGADPGLTCCQAGTLADPVSHLHSRIDLVLTHAVSALSARVVGAAPFEAVPPLWPSDHAGVVAELRLH